MKTAALLVYRALVIAACVFSVWRSVQFATADWVASPNTVQALTRAAQDSPNDPRLLARLALARSDAADPDPGVDEQLRRAARLDPFNSEVLMTLGLHEEFAGNPAAAERELTKAAGIDHQFKPAWTLASFYARKGEPAKAWPMIQRILDLDPLGFDLTPVFDLCWRLAGDNPAQILSLIPKNGPKPVQYLAFLMATNRAAAALQVWPAALAAVRRSEAPDDLAAPRGFPDFLVRAGRVAESVNVWNQLVDSGTVHSGHLEPAKGDSIADPEFKFPAGVGFAWRLDDVPGVSSNIYGGALHLELSSDEPESFRVLSSLAPLLPDHHYRLVWKTDSSGASDPKDPGFRFRIAQSSVEQGTSQAPGSVVRESVCPPLLTSSACDFSSAPGDRMGTASLSLEYTRAQGTTRISGNLGLSAVRLELMP